MPRWLFAAALTTLAVAFAATPARAGWFSSHGACHDECAPTCAVPSYAHAPACAAPVDCYTAPTCCAPTCSTPVECSPGYGCGDVCCDGSYQERDGCLRRSVRKLWDLEQRKNRCLKRTFCGWMHRDRCDDCAPLEYYQPSCGAPHGCCY